MKLLGDSIFSKINVWNSIIPGIFNIKRLKIVYIFKNNSNSSLSN